MIQDKIHLGHLIHDAPEILIGVTSGIIAGKKVASSIYKLQKNIPLSKSTSILAGLVTSAIAGYASYSFVKKLKEF